jgi:hypothetical protein
LIDWVRGTLIGLGLSHLTGAVTAILAKLASVAADLAGEFLTTLRKLLRDAKRGVAGGKDAVAKYIRSFELEIRTSTFPDLPIRRKRQAKGVGGSAPKRGAR